MSQTSGKGAAEPFYGEPKHTHLNHHLSFPTGFVELIGQASGMGILVGYLVVSP